MNSQLSLFHLYQTKGRNNHPLRVYTRNNQIPLLNTKSALINQEKSNLHSIEYRMPNSFRIELKQAKSNHSSLTKKNSLHQTMNPHKPKFNNDYNSFIRNTQPMRNVLEHPLDRKMQIEQKKLINFKAKQKEEFATQKDSMRQLLYLQRKPMSLILKANQNLEVNNNNNKEQSKLKIRQKQSQKKEKSNNITFHPEKKIMMKSMYSSNVKCDLSNVEENNVNDNIDMFSSFSKSKNHCSSNQDSDDNDNSGILTFSEVKDLIIYHDFEHFRRDYSYLFHRNDYETFIKTKLMTYMNAFDFN